MGTYVYDNEVIIWIYFSASATRNWYKAHDSIQTRLSSQTLPSREGASACVPGSRRATVLPGNGDFWGTTSQQSDDASE